MHSESVKLALYDIRDNIVLAGKFVEGLTCQGFCESGIMVQTPPGGRHNPGRLSSISAFKGCRP
jgi:hypothetical protein